MNSTLFHQIRYIRNLIYIAAIVFFIISLSSCGSEPEPETYVVYGKSFWPPDMVPHPMPPSPKPDDGRA